MTNLTELADRVEALAAWLPVINQRRGGYMDGFDPNREYDFKRLGSDQIERYRLGDQPDWFNVAGLLFATPAITLCAAYARRLLRARETLAP